MKKKDFIKSGGSKEAWKDCKKLLNDYDIFESNYKFHSNRAQLTDQRIKEWQSTSPDVFKAADEATDPVSGINIDFVIFLDCSKKDENGNEIFENANNLNYSWSSKYDTNIWNFKHQGLHFPTAIKFPFYEGIDSSKQYSTIHDIQYVYDHEADNFVYIVESTTAYINYTLELQKKIISNKGGHHSCYLSGRLVKKRGSKLNDTTR